MSHWAEINENNMVIRVVVGNDEDPDEGYQWLIDNLGGTWVKTSYNTIGGVHTLGGTPFRKNFAGVGFTYDAQRDAFIPPKLFPSWILDEDTCFWKAPVPHPGDGKVYRWIEENLNWVEIPTPEGV